MIYICPVSREFASHPPPPAPRVFAFRARSLSLGNPPVTPLSRSSAAPRRAAPLRATPVGFSRIPRNLCGARFLAVFAYSAYRADSRVERQLSHIYAHAIARVASRSRRLDISRFYTLLFSIEELDATPRPAFLTLAKLKIEKVKLTLISPKEVVETWEKLMLKLKREIRFSSIFSSLQKKDDLIAALNLSVAKNLYTGKPFAAKYRWGINRKRVK